VESVDATDRENISKVEEFSADTWFEIANWAKQTSNLQSWQRGLAFSIGKLIAQGKPPSRKQARRGIEIIDEATKLGYRSTEST